jgi:hypothetical protein
MNKPLRNLPMKIHLALLVSLLLSGCAIGAGKSMPYEAWRLGFFAPDYMEVWVETANAVDIKERVFRGAGGGVVSIGYPTAFSGKEIPNTFKGNPKGWPKRPGWGAGRYVMGADLPRLIYVRWQSLVEPQTYEAYIEIPESVRAIMRKGEKAYCNADDKWITDYREAISIGLAPGGIAKAWVLGPCLPPIEIARVEATVDPRGPYEGKSGGRHRPLSATSKAYVEKYGIPFGSW